MWLSGGRTFQAEELTKQRSQGGCRHDMFEVQRGGQCGWGGVHEDRVVADEVRKSVGGQEVVPYRRL